MAMKKQQIAANSAASSENNDSAEEQIRQVRAAAFALLDRTLKVG